MNQERSGAPIEIDYGGLLRSCLIRVFNERDEERRLVAISELFVDEPTMFEPHAIVEGREAISCVTGELLSQFGDGFEYVSQGRGHGHHQLGLLRWIGQNGGRVILAGANAAEIADGKISRLWIYVDPIDTTR